MAPISPLSTRSPLQMAIPPIARATSAPPAMTPASTIVTLSTAAHAAANSVRGQGSNAGMAFKPALDTVIAALKSNAPLSLERPQPPDDADQRFSLNVITASGARFDLTLSAGDEGVQVLFGANSALRDDERQAMAQLAQGFQRAVDGMTAVPPRVLLAELAGLAGGVLKSVDVQATVRLPTIPPATQSMDFHADAMQRSVQLDGPAGKVALSVDTSMIAQLGAPQQQERAIDNYLAQVDQAAARGHGDAALVALFKDAFADLARTQDAEPSARAAPAVARTAAWPLSAQEQAVLTGLPDFSASMTQAPQRNNPVRAGEVTGFNYALSQQTSSGGLTHDSRSLAQTQQSTLTAQFHQPLRAGAALAFDYASDSQNYTYHQIADEARSDVRLGYRDGRLQDASLIQTASQSERVERYVQGRRVADDTTTSGHQLLRNLLAGLTEVDGASGATDRQRALGPLGNHVLLTGDPQALAARDAALRV